MGDSDDGAFGSQPPARPPAPLARFVTRRDLKWALWAFLATVMLGVVMVASGIHHGEPYRLVMKPSDEGTAFRFEHPEYVRVSPEFTTEQQLVERPSVIVLDGDVDVPGGHVESYDATVLPGRFRIRIGGVAYDLVPHSIEVDGTPLHWQAAVPDP